MKHSVKNTVNKVSVNISWQTCITVAVSVFVLYLATIWWRPLMQFLWKLLSSAAPLFIGFIIAYIVNILMDFYERHYFTSRSEAVWVKKSKRAVCLTGALGTMLGAMILILVLVIPQLARAFTVIQRRIPRMMETLAANDQIMGMLPENIRESITTMNFEALVTGIMEFFTNGASAASNAQNVTSILGSVTSKFMMAFMGFIFSIYILIGKEKLTGQFKRLSNVYFGKSLSRFAPALKVANECFHHFIVGQVTEAIIIGVLCSIGMFVLRLPYAAMVGTVVGVTALIPVLGCYLGAAVGALMCLSVNPAGAVEFLIFILLLQQFEGNLIYPRVVGTSLGLPGIWVLAAVSVGGGIGGVVGMLFSVPLAATIYQLIKMDMNERESGAKKGTLAEEIAGHLKRED